MIRYDTKKVVIANPEVILKDFSGFYFLKKDKDEVNAAVTLEPTTVRIKAICTYIAGSEPETHGFILLFRPSGQTKAAYSLNIKTDSSDKVVTLDQEIGYPAKPINNVEVKKVDTHNRFEVDLIIPLKEIGMSTGIAPGEYIELNILKYRGASQPYFTSSFPLRTSFYHDTATDKEGRCVTKKHFHVSTDIIRQGRFHRIYYGFMKNSEYECSLGDQIQDVSVTFLYKNFTRKEIVLKGQPELLKGDWNFFWKAPDENIITVENKVVHFMEEGSCVEVEFSHPEPFSKGAYELHLVSGSKKVMILSFDKDDLYKAGKQAMPPLLIDRSIKGKTKITQREISSKALKLAEHIPDRVGIYWVGSPSNPHLWPYQLYDWNHEKPEEITLKKDGSIWPDQKVFENKKHIMKNDLGQDVEYPYYEDRDQKQYFLSMHAEFFQRAYVLAELPLMAKEDPLGAAYVLLKLTEAYKKYVPVYDTYWRGYPVDKKLGPPYPYWGGVWSYWFYTDLSVLAKAADALQLVKQTDALEVLSQKLRFDVYEKLVSDLFRPSVDFIMSYKTYNSNMDYCKWLGLTAISIAISEPDYMHEAYERMIDYVSSTSLFDGFFMETTLSYHNQSVGGILRVAERMKGYSDPPGYISPLTGKRFDNLDPASLFPMIEESLALPWKLSYPNGKLVPIQDTWAFDQRTGECSDYEKSILVPAAGIAKLALGSGTKQSQLYLMFTTKYGHNHYDPLNIAFYAYGCELLPDIGYNYTRYRCWSASTLAHNTVTVNSTDAGFKGSANHGGNIEVFAVDEETVQIVKANQNTAYDTTSEYSRELWRIDTDRDLADAGYVVDFFRVIGGKCHEYSLNYDANHDAKMVVEKAKHMTDDPLIPLDVPVQLPDKASDKGDAKGHYYAYLYPKRTQKAYLESDQYKVVATSFNEEGKPIAGMTIHGLMQDESDELLLCEVPSVRATRLFGVAKDSNDEAEKYSMPKMICRRTGDQSDSLFIHVLEPVDPSHPAQIKDIKTIKGPKNKDGTYDVVLIVSYGDTKDYMILSESDSFTMGIFAWKVKEDSFVRETAWW